MTTIFAHAVTFTEVLSAVQYSAFPWLVSGRLSNEMVAEKKGEAYGSFERAIVYQPWMQSVCYGIWEYNMASFMTVFLLDLRY